MIQKYAQRLKMHRDENKAMCLIRTFNPLKNKKQYYSKSQMHFYLFLLILFKYVTVTLWFIDEIEKIYQ